MFYIFSMPQYNLSKRAEKITVEDDWVILHNLSNLGTPKFLKVNIKDTAEVPRYGFFEREQDYRDRF